MSWYLDLLPPGPVSRYPRNAPPHPKALLAGTQTSSPLTRKPCHVAPVRALPSFPSIPVVRPAKPVQLVLVIMLQPSKQT